MSSCSHNTNKEKFITLFESSGLDGYIQNHGESCTCRQISRTCIRILAESNINLKNKPICLSYQTLVESGATAENLQNLYMLWPKKLGNFKNMIEWMFATRKSESLNKLNDFIIQSVTHRFNNSSAASTICYEYLENKENTLKKIKNNLYNSGIFSRWSPGILMSLYIWAQKCDCCQRHKKNFPYFNSSSDWWISCNEHSNL